MDEKQIVAYLQMPQAIREQCNRLFSLACDHQLAYFGCDLSQLPQVADYVISITKDNYGDGEIPFHSRWRHFEVGDVPRLQKLQRQLLGFSPLEIAQAKFDLVITSVLLDAGAGASWCYRERETGQVFSRSEGLAVASFHLFCQGFFSSNPKQPFQADAEALQSLTREKLAQGFQVSETNPLVGLEGRVKLLQRLGEVMQKQPHIFGVKQPRLGNLVNYLLADTSTLTASRVFQALLTSLGEIWSGRIILGGVNLGDVWRHRALETEIPYIPFHKLSQWLTYSLLEPLMELGYQVTGLEELTGLPEYRNGGLCLDLGLLQIKQPQILQQHHTVDSEVIVEWRALTVALLDQIAATIRDKLELSATELPLVKILQGGTWMAGRRIASQRRVGGVSPLSVISDGTVF